MADWPPLKAASFLVVFPIYDSTGCPVYAGAGLAACISTDGGAFAAATCTVSEINASAGVYKFIAASNEMNGDVIAWKAISTTGSARPAIGVMYTAASRQMKDVLHASQIFNELSQAQPASNPTVEQATMLLYMALRNSASTTTSEYKVTNNSGTVIAKASITESASAFERAKMQSGP